MNPTLTINAAVRQGDCPHFWKAIGCDEAFKWTLHESGEALLAEIRRTGCIQWIRNHHALSSPIVTPDGREHRAFGLQGDEPVFDFAGLDAVYDRWLAAGVRPIVELDFLPPKLSQPGSRLPLNTPSMWEHWRLLLRAFLTHLQERYGVEETRRWYFEFWNEPDLWPHDRLGELWRLYDESVAAVEAVDPQLRIGGPAAAALPITDAFLQQITFGQNTLTGKTGSRCDYVSFHQYGVSGNTLPYYPAMLPRPQDIATRCYWLYELMCVFPGAREKEFHLNEWGMISHFEKTAYQFPPLEIRNGEHFPLFMFKLIHLLFTLADYRGNWLPTIMLLWAGVPEAYWSALPDERSKRFKGRSGLFAGNRSLLTAGNLAKPILRGFELLTGLGTQRLACTGGAAGESLAAIATHGQGAVQLLLYHFHDDPAVALPEKLVRVRVENLSVEGPAELRIARLDRLHANAYRAWEAMGRPENPTEAQWRSLHAAGRFQEPLRWEVEVCGGVIEFSLPMPFPGAALVQITPRQGEFAPPDRPAKIVTIEQMMA